MNISKQAQAAQDVLKLAISKGDPSILTTRDLSNIQLCIDYLTAKSNALKFKYDDLKHQQAHLLADDKTPHPVPWAAFCRICALLESTENVDVREIIRSEQQ